ncbi:MAG: hypothetical protein HQM00_16905, partial [Magnetococcales bacterium]|nr:hypothetical protein [Magnetococcales bacterium]
MTTLSDADFAVCELPPTLRLLVEVAGLPATLALVTRFGGTEVCVPVRIDPDSDLVATVGAEVAQKLVMHFSGERVYIPKGDRALRCARNRNIVREYDQGGVTAGQLALRHGLTERMVRSILGDSTQGSAQLTMRF